MGNLPSIRKPMDLILGTWLLLGYAYIPLTRQGFMFPNHVSYITMTKLDGQLSEQFVSGAVGKT